MGVYVLEDLSLYLLVVFLNKEGSKIEQSHREGSNLPNSLFCKAETRLFLRVGYLLQPVDTPS